ncbi:MAG: 2-hydroxyacyl-CoA dehydratase [Chloroflexi bacterium]|nr:2-hydroxyacyl-CoA dehydratase [Chloroflexota bacterium]
MNVKTAELDKLERTVEVLDRLVDHRRKKPTTKSDELYYDLFAKYMRRLIHAKEQGKTIGAHSVLVPAEIFYAMDMVPLHLEMTCMMMAIFLKEEDEFLARAKAFGLPPEVCSTHRCIAATYEEKWVPRPDAVVWTNQVCDNTAKSNEIVVNRSGAPGFYMDVPFRLGDASIRFVAGELEDLLHGLENVTGKKLDRDRLTEVLRLAQKSVDLLREIEVLRRATPCPASNTVGSQILNVGWLFMGQPEGVAYLETVRDELKERVAAGKGVVPKENFRLISLFIPPSHNWRILHWMEREHGATVVAEPYCTHWGDIDWNFSKPFETLAHRMYANPISREMQGPVEEGLVEDSVNDAQKSKADGAIYWAHTGCRQTCATIRITKDTLRDRASIPTLVLDCDLTDPTFVSDEAVKEKLEGFFETLAENK